MRGAALILAIVAVGAPGVARARDGGAPPAGAAAALETQHLTHAGEGSAGTRRLFRNGCHRGESRGSPGGGGDVLDTEVGCAPPAMYATMFGELDALIARGALVPEEKSAAGGAQGRAGGMGVGGDFESARSIVIDARGRRLAPSGPEATKELAAIAMREPTIDWWYVKPPSPPRGTGAQLAVVSASKGQRRLQAMLVATGEWWCYLTVPATGAPAREKLTAAPRPLAAGEATAMLGRVLAGITERSLAKGEAAGNPMGDETVSVEAAVGAGPRTAVRPPAAAAAAARRFSDELAPRSAACRP